MQTYFYNGSNYWRRNSDLRYTQLTGGENMLNHLAIEQGVGNEAAKVALYMIQSEQQVGFAGRVAGYQAGPREEGGRAYPRYRRTDIYRAQALRVLDRHQGCVGGFAWKESRPLF